jgi:hypothetical protein
MTTGGVALPTDSPDSAPALARKLGLFDVTMLVMGTVIGTGIFVVPHTVASLVGSPSLVLLAWAFGGVFSMAGGLVYAELTRSRPNVGGQYAYLRDAYHPAVAFVYGWSLLWIIQSGGLASVAVIFGRYFIELTRFLAEWTGQVGSLGFFAKPLSAFAESSFHSSGDDSSDRQSHPNQLCRGSHGQYGAEHLHGPQGAGYRNVGGLWFALCKRPAVQPTCQHFGDLNRLADLCRLRRRDGAGPLLLRRLAHDHLHRGRETCLVA